MDINRNNIIAYKSKINKVKNSIENLNADKIIDDINKSQAIIQRNLAEERIDNLSKNILDMLLLNFNLKNNKNLKDLIDSYQFPNLKEDNLNSYENKLVVDLYNYKHRKDRLNDLKKEYMPTINSLEKDIDFIAKNDKSIIFSLFQSKEIKSKLKEAKENVETYFYKVDVAENDINNISQKLDLDSEVNSDLIKDKYNYLRTLAELTSYDIENLDFLLEAFEEQMKILDGYFSNYDSQRLIEKIKNLWENLKLEKLPEELSELSLDIINASTDINLPIEKLGDMFTINDIKAKTTEELQKITGLNLKQAHDIKSVNDNFVEQYKDNYYPKIDLENLSYAEIELLEVISQYKNLDNKNKDDYEKVKVLLKSCNSLLNFIVEKAPNSYKKALLTKEEYKKIDESTKEFLNIFDSILGFYKTFPSIEKPSSSELKSDFSQDSASYYAIIDKASGQKNTYMPNNLPEFIVKKVNEFQLNTDDLNGTLRGYQEFGSKYALMYKKTLLGDEMGLGKTVQALAVVGHLMKEGKKHSIVIAPLTLLSNWSREIKKWLGYDVYVFRSNKREEEYQSWKENGGVLLTNYEQTSQLLTSIENSESKIDLIVVDEAHKIKNPLAKRSINTYNITEKAEYALFMTGTALENRLQEMKQLISVLQPKLIERIEKQAQDDDPIKFKKLVSLVYLRRKREEVLKELPDIEIIEQWSKFTEVQQAYYNEAVSKGISGMMSMRRAAFYEEENHQSEKIEQIISICEEAKDNGHKIIIFSFFKIVLKKILEYLKEETVGMISGDITTDERQKLIDDLTLAESGSVLLAQIDAGGTGLNIQAANVVILCEPQFKPSTENQAISRVYRMGQTKNVIVYRLLTDDSIDETMLELLGRKTKIFDIYAKNSAVAEAFDTQAEIDIPEDKLQRNIFEIERRRLENSLDKGDESTKEAL